VEGPFEIEKEFTNLKRGPKAKKGRIYALVSKRHLAKMFWEGRDFQTGHDS